MTGSRQQWLRARDEYVALLKDPNSLEIQWQRLFTKCPFILTDCLALGIKPRELIPAKPGQAKADFYFFPETQDTFSPYGVIEIKRPGTPILKEPRKDVICLASGTYTAVAQAQKYALELEAEIAREPSHQIFFGTPHHMFVISGLSSEIAQKVITELHLAQFNRHFPPGLRLVTYDELSGLLASRVPPKMHMAVPWYPGMTDRSPASRSLFHVREMYVTKCGDCGQDTEVPFKPTEGRPVFCRKCYQKHRKPRPRF